MRFSFSLPLMCCAGLIFIMANPAQAFDEGLIKKIAIPFSPNMLDMNHVERMGQKNIHRAASWKNYKGRRLYCHYTGCMSAKGTPNFMGWCYYNKPRFPVQIPGWEMIGKNVCNEPITGAWYCCSANSPGGKR